MTTENGNTKRMYMLMRKDHLRTSYCVVKGTQLRFIDMTGLKYFTEICVPIDFGQ
jgi:hypothetical protein